MKTSKAVENRGKKAGKSPNYGKQSEIARLAGVSTELVSRKREQGKLVERDGIIDVAASVRVIQGLDEPVVQASEEPPISLETFAAAQSRKEIALANLRELEYERLVARSVDVADVEKYLATATKAVTNQLLSIAEKVAPLIAALTDVRECRDLILKHIKEALMNLPEKIDLQKAA